MQLIAVSTWQVVQLAVVSLTLPMVLGVWRWSGGVAGRACTQWSTWGLLVGARSLHCMFATSEAFVGGGSATQPTEDTTIVWALCQLQVSHGPNLRFCLPRLSRVDLGMELPFSVRLKRQRKSFPELRPHVRALPVLLWPHRLRDVSWRNACGLWE